ncbi:MAG: 50S ribosomal protein L18 [Acidobacteriota bacterium]|nr:50S ribosomal protein L18 [Acidobacteriota bacterium]MDH3785940.1 50S ribosomal protein L18 [Acidobacteriota bacterium]
MSVRKDVRRRIRHRVRRKIHGTASQPRLAVFRSDRHIYAQAIDDESGRTLASASTQSPELKEIKNGSNCEAAKKVGNLIAKKLKGAGVKAIVFDRGGFLYHGRIKALADAAREEGLKF